MTIINQYQNGNCAVTLHADGTKIREYEGVPVPKYPESLDVKITNWCDAGCAWCHEKSTVHGLHGDLRNTIDLLKQLPAGVEIAIGGGHPLSHPDFDNFVTELSEHGLICNVTINEHHFQKEVGRIEKLISKDLIKGVGYSFKKDPCKWKYEHLVNHVIIGVHNYRELKTVTQVNRKVLLLGYKRVGKGVAWNDNHEKLITNNINSWYRGLFSAAKEAHISFDNLAIKQLNPKRLFINQKNYEEFYMGDDGGFSMYIDAVNQNYAVSSTSDVRRGYQQDISNMFSTI